MNKKSHNISLRLTHQFTISSFCPCGIVYHMLITLCKSKERWNFFLSLRPECLSHFFSGFWRRRLLRFALTSRSAVRVTTPGCGRKFSSLLICHPVPDSFHVIVSSEGFADNFSSILPRTFNFLTFTPTQIGTIVFKLVLIPVVFSTLPCQCASTLMCPCWPSCSPALIVWSYYCQYLHVLHLFPGPSMSCQPEHPTC